VSATTDQQQLEWERRAGRSAALAAFAAALLPFIGNFVLVASIGGREGRIGLLQAAAEEATGIVASGALTAAGALLLIVPLRYLHHAARARREETPAFASVLLIGGAVGLAVTLMVQQFVLIDVGNAFLAGPEQTEGIATGALEASALQTSQLVRLGLSVVLGGAILLIALNAMRAGLLSRFMGIVGIALGAFYAIPFLGGPAVIQLFWMAALGLLLLDRWPGGRGPAWQTVEALPWPTQAQRVEAQRRGRVEGAGPSEEVTPGPEPSDGGDPERPRPASRKRRRGR
jgi:hypothetical protein